VVGAGDGFAGQVVNCAGKALGDAAGVDEDKGGRAASDDFEQAGMDGLPDGRAFWSLRGVAGGLVLGYAEAGHVFDGDFDAEFERLASAGVHDGYGAVADGG
jgi:hypothetical protein